EGEGRVVRHAGNYSLYTQLAASADTDKGEQKAALKSVQKKSSAKAGLSYKEQQELAGIEARLPVLEEQITDFERRLSDPVAHGLGIDHQQITKIAGELESLRAE